MYKKLLFSLLLASASVVAFAQDDDQEETVGAHPWKEVDGKVSEEFSHWGLIVEGGFNGFDGDFNSEMKHQVFAPSAGLTVMYDFTPAWGVGIDYHYDWYRVTGRGGSQHATNLLEGMMHRAGAYLTFDFIHTCFPRTKKSIFSILLIGGGGTVFYKNDVYYVDASRGHTADFSPLSDQKYRNTMYLMGGTMLDFNVSRSIALGLKLTYSYFMRDDVDGRGLTASASKNNDGILDMTLALRYKIDAQKHTHVRNISSIEGFERSMDKLHGAKKDTLYIIQRDTVVMAATGAGGSGDIINNHSVTNNYYTSEEDNYYYVYFDNAKAKLTDEGLATIQQVASRLGRDSSMYAVVIGYCDNTGSQDYNMRLAKNRASNVSDELYAEYAIPEERMLTVGKGILVGKRSTSAYSPNRRTEVRLVNREWFEKLKQQYRDAVVAPEESESMSIVPVDGKIADVTVKNNMTLSKLARRYYHNTHCWIYIYEANMDVMSSPNDLEPGMNLVIPELTPEQKETTAEECKQRFRSLDYDRNNRAAQSEQETEE